MPGAGGVDRDGHFVYAGMRGRVELVCGETVVRGCGSGCICGVGAWMQLNVIFWEVNQCPFGFFSSSAIHLLLKKSVITLQVNRLHEQCLEFDVCCRSRGICRHHMGWYACCVCGEKVSGWAQSVLTCVTCASAVWLVDWMNIGWVSSCPAGIVTCWIWYNCCKTEKQTRRMMVSVANLKV